MDALTQRLREGVVTSTYDGFVVIDPPTALTREALARIEALEAEVARLRGADAVLGAVWEFGMTTLHPHPPEWPMVLNRVRNYFVERDEATPPHVQHTAGVDATAPTSAD